MKTKIINLYQFSELSEEAKKKVLDKQYDINVSSDWWDSIYDDADNIGLKITGFDIDRGSYVNANFKVSAPETAEAIRREHGEICETYKTASKFLNELNALTSIKENIEDVPEDEIEELENEFLKSLSEDYLILLRKSYEYLTGNEAIIGTIEANEYYFDDNGTLTPE